MVGTWTLPSPRLLVERFSGRFWAWLDREEFLLPKNVLDIVEGQTVTWMGLFYCPLLPLLNSIFIFLTFYIKKVRAQGLGGSRAAPVWAPRVPTAEQPSPAAAPPGTSHLHTALTAPCVLARSLVHPAEELQGVPSAIPRLQLHLLLPAGAHPGPAPGRCAPGLCGQQVRGAEGLRLLGRQLLTRALTPALLWRSLPSIRSSWDCGLFTNYSAPWQVVPELVALRLPPPSQRILHYLGSHAFRFPLLILLRCLSGQQGPREGAPPASLMGPGDQTRRAQGRREPGSQGQVAWGLPCAPGQPPQALTCKAGTLSDH